MKSTEQKKLFELKCAELQRKYESCFSQGKNFIDQFIFWGDDSKEDDPTIIYSDYADAVVYARVKVKKK